MAAKAEEFQKAGGACMFLCTPWIDAPPTQRRRRADVWPSQAVNTPVGDR